MTSHSYIFFTVKDSFNTLPATTKEKFKKAFVKELKQEKSVISYTYATLGLKINTSLMIWFQAESIDEIQLFLNKLMHTKLGEYLQISHTLFGMIRPTQYSHQSLKHLDTQRKGGKYLTIYPFTKTKNWYFLDLDARKKIMSGHITIGKKYPQIEQLLLYSYGVDDSEFIVSYEMDDLSAFQSLVMELRSDKTREYTLKDTPIFTCIYKTPEEAVDFL